ncbi:lysophospholipid acyltransferase family protein [Motiliproteus sediminis]|uniref:lysophospholipid acyltransferase family protein n=1 Tax=Motiliproteus sediminis TaxID=1468178 RepID=UPI001AEF57F6|nr:lysophospholipid acyltransferase family protein [Motiliproteus sediminis]
MIAWLCSLILKLSGWTIDDQQRPAIKRYVLIGYPHTSNWDFVLAMLVKGALGFQFNWVAKHTLFRWPLGPLMRAMGGIGVDRTQSTGFTAALAAEYGRRESLVVVITPEGTRAHRPYWKSGFYHLALEAGVPVVLGYLDAPSKRIGFGPSLTLSGDRDQDLARIRAFYADKRGIHPADAGTITFTQPPS